MKISKFKIYPNEKRKHYYLAFVFESKADMYNFHLADIIKTGEKKWKFKYEALCRSWLCLSPRNQRNIIGHIYFYKGYIGAGIVSHEFAHAACFYFRSVLKKTFIEKHGKFFVHKDEEEFCEVLGEMNRQFWNKYYRYCSKEVKTV